MQTIDKGMALLKELTAKHPELKELQRQKNLAIKEEITANDLADAVIKMSANIFRIGVLTAELCAKANEAYTYRKLKYMFSFSSLTEKITQKDKEALSTQAVEEQYEEELVNRFVADYMKNLYDDYNRLISVLQSKLALLRSEMSKLN